MSGTVVGTVVQAGQVGQLHLAHPAPTALAGLPPAVAEFTGREAALRGVVAALRPGADGSPVVVSALAGAAGVGKTALTLRAAHDALSAGWFSGGVLFADLQGYDEKRRVRPDAALATFLSALGVPDELFPPSPEGRLALYRSRLAELAARRHAVLVVLDNASSTEQVVPLLPGSPVHRVLVTSRHTLGDLPGSRIVDIGVLEPEEAAALIVRTLGVRRPDDTRALDEPDAVHELAALCGHLPLALAVVASILAGDPDQSVGELAAALRDRAGRLDELSYAGGRSVTAAFELSYAGLTPEEARMFRLLSVNLGQQVSPEAAAALAGLPVPAAGKLLRALRAAHMLEPGKPRGAVRFHDLLRLFAERRRREEDEALDQGRSVGAAVDRLLTHYRDAARNCTERIVAAAREARRDDDAESWLDVERPSLRSALQLALLHGRSAVALSLAHDVSWFLRRQQDWAAALEVCDTALALVRSVAPGSAQEVLALYDRGDLLKHMQDFDRAQQTLAQALHLYRRLGDRAGEAMTLHSLGTAARRDGRHERATAHYTAALTLFRELGDRQAVGNTLHNLGTTAMWQGDHAAARARYDSALDTYHQLGHTLGRARTLDRLGRLDAATGHPDSARDHWHQARTAYEEAGLSANAEEVTDLLAALPGPPDR
ncbi:ATP-binding protein [Kitasatospora mediocidica]|uniref:ATP-binding protein n=1 Tax=Kitasatospora mediocidica TaxID=58352 RepID=UPI0012FBB273|nr:tetratricopeptide repeat protein [Kitasatospora mediocidica]